MIKTRIMKTEVGVDAAARVHEAGVETLMLYMDNSERVKEFREMVRRGLNTFDNTPPWLLELSDLLESKLEPSS